MFIPISDDNPTLRFPLMTVLLLLAIGAVWILIQSAGTDPRQLAGSVCRLGLIPLELTHRGELDTSVLLGARLRCKIGDDPLNLYTPLTSMFLHGSWSHVLGNCLFLWVFGNNVEDSMGRGRFLIFYLLCGLAAAAAQIAASPSSPVPMVGASGAISGVLAAYLFLYPRVRVLTLVGWFLISLPAYLVLLSWIALQVMNAYLARLSPEASGVAVWAHIGGFAAGALFVHLFRNRALVDQRTVGRHRLHPDHP
ncbi:MAG TPA: rhomboid family intramembrane serine protease [Polyangia bacterium]|nr:rhomboid family intramembrane serine protease [Polyangia bacterium]